MAASGQSDSADSDLEDLSDQITVDASQDVTVEAAEEATLEVADEESASTLTPLPLSSATPPPSRRAPTLMGLPLPSLPLPGVTAAASHYADHDTDDDITVMARPSVTDDEEEATKVEPAETALHAAASKDDDELTTALSAQASVERERALRKSMPPSLDLPLSAHGYGSDDSAEFEDPEEDDGIQLSTETPGIAVDDDAIATSSYSADTEEPSSELEAVLAPRRPTATLGSLGSGSLFGGSPALGRSDGFGALRLPTPSPGFGGLSLPSPTQVPAPSSSPFSARLAPIGSPYNARGTSSAPMPALQIPAPSGVAATTAGTNSGFFRKAQMPVAAVVLFVVAAFIFGVVTGVKFIGGRAAPTMAATQPAPASAPVVIQPIAQPVAPTAAATPTPATPTPVAAAPTPAAPTPVAAAPTTAPAAAAPVAEENAIPTAKPAPKPAIKRSARPAVHKTTTASLDAPLVAKPTAAKAKPVKGGKSSKAWVDPFAE
jgi:hypothetical protein